MDLDALRGRFGTAVLDHGGPITAAQARMLACDAMIIPAVLGSGSQVLDVGTAVRLFPQPIRRAITLRDRGCTFPGCDRPATWCDCHHVKAWADGGPTSLANGVLLCPHHHRQIHRGHWEIRFAADGVPEYLPPTVDRPEPHTTEKHHAPQPLPPTDMKSPGVGARSVATKLDRAWANRSSRRAAGLTVARTDSEAVAWTDRASLVQRCRRPGRILAGRTGSHRLGG